MPTWPQISVMSVISLYVCPSNVPPFTCEAISGPPTRNAMAMSRPPAATNGIM
ncbi:unannotated protein [freshwater metagenome]|uniref:Unannotated protein n=1 Tax=freshwater metagenome TaxID=449393 RepID=A0A6J7JX46_9ZZZZ